MYKKILLFALLLLASCSNTEEKEKVEGSLLCHITQVVIPEE